MEYTLVLDRSLGVDPAAFAAWQAAPPLEGQARVAPAPPVFYDTSLLEVVGLTISTVGAALVAAGVQQIVSSLTGPPTPPSAEPPAAPHPSPVLPPVEVVTCTAADGAPLIVVRRAEPSGSPRP